MEKINVLITAVGSELSFSILKALKKVTTLNITTIGCDIYPEVVGKYWCDYFHQVPPVKEKEAYISAIKNLIKTHHIKFIIPTSDYELPILSEIKNVLLTDFQCHALVNNIDMLSIFNNKWKAHEYLLKNDVPVPKTIHIQQSKNIFEDLQKEQIDYPFIIKPIIGGGSRAIYKINNETQLRQTLPILESSLIQEYLHPDNEEYSAGTYRTSNNKVFVIILKRTLKFGMTNTASVVDSEELTLFCKQTILKTDLIGSNNIQFRLTKSGPKILEINPRFSGTTGIRANFGFNDVEMWVKDLLNHTLFDPTIIKGFVLRFMEEQYHFDS